MRTSVLLAAAAAVAAFGASALAQGTGGAPKPRTAASIECSRQADAKGLHGTPRKHFRSQCMRSMAKAGNMKTDRPLGYR